MIHGSIWVQMPQPRFTPRVVTMMEQKIQMRNSYVMANIIMNTICDYYGIAREMMKAKSRRQTIVVPKQMACYFIRKCTTLTLSEIGSLFNDLDHTTVIHSCKTITDRADTEDAIRADMEILSSHIIVKK